MPVTADLPPFPSHDAFVWLADHIDAVKAEASDVVALGLFETMRREWRATAALLVADPGTPAKKLTKEQRAKVRGLAKADISAADITTLLAWFDEAILRLQRLRHARAA